MIKNFILKRKETIIIGLLTIIVFLTHIIYVKDTGIIYNLDDEYGYWGNAAYFSGFDWSSTVSKIPYYSYGYSFLLIPLFKVFENTTTMYKAAVSMNGIMVSISFLLCYDIAKKLIKNCNRIILLSISFLISMYPSYIVYSHITMSECLLMLIFWILSWCFVDLSNKTSIYKFISIGVLSSYIYMVHQRTLGILVASVTVISIMKIYKKITIKQFLSVILPIIAIMIIHTNLKNSIQCNLWLNGSGLAINDYSGQLNKLNQLLSVKGFIIVTKVFVGHLFYMGVATLLMVYFSMYELVQKISIIKLNNKDENVDCFYIFILISFIFTITISAIFFINLNRIDNIVFGRYNEIIIEPILLLGFAKLIKMEKLSNKQYIIIVFIFLLHTAIADFIIQTSGLRVINVDTLSTIALNLMNYKFGVLLPALISIILFRLIWISFQNANTNLVIITMVVVSIVFCNFGVKGAKSITYQQQDMLEILKVTDKITFYEENLPIYFLVEDPDEYVAVEWNGRTIRDRSVSDCYQFILKDKKIVPINLDDLKLVNEDKFVITTSNINTNYLLDKYELCGSDSGSFLFKTK